MTTSSHWNSSKLHSNSTSSASDLLTDHSNEHVTDGHNNSNDDSAVSYDVANIALQMLEADYRACLQASTTHKVSTHSNHKDPNNHATSTSIISDVDCNLMKDSSDNERFVIDDPNGYKVLEEEDYNSDWDSNASSTSSFSFVRDDDNMSYNSNNISTDIDVDAVRKAMQNIRMNHPDFSAKLDQQIISHSSQSHQCPHDQQHHCLPPIRIQDIFRTTCNMNIDNSSNSKSIKFQTAELSRSATLALAVTRLFGLYSSEDKKENYSNPNPTSMLKHLPEIFQIHVIGCDHVECTSGTTMLAFFQPFIEWMFHASTTLQKIVLVLIGPGVPKETSNLFDMHSPLELVPSGITKKNNQDNLDKSASIFCVTNTYEEYCSTLSEHQFPDLVIAYNAGIWGYNDWLPTISFMASLESNDCAIPFVVTSYTIEEADDDEDTIASHLKCLNLNGFLLWESEINPYASQIDRPTQTAIDGRVYRENAAWQCWYLGKSS